MGIAFVNEITGRGGDQQRNSRRRYTRIFRVYTDDTTTGTKSVLAAAGVPDYGDTWEEVDADGAVTDEDTDAFCVEKRAQQGDDNDPQNWLVTCEYVGIGDPTLEPPEVEWIEEKWQENYTKDALDVAVLNAAGDPFESGLQRDADRIGVIITRNQLTFDPIDAASYKRTTNEEEFLADRHPPGFDAGTCKMDSITAKPVYYEDYPTSTDIHYWRVTYRVMIDLDGWEAAPLNAGLQMLQKDNAGNYILKADGTKKKYRIMDDGTGALCSTPQLLKSDGTRAAVGDAPVYLSFTPYTPKSWEPLNLTY